MESTNQNYFLGVAQSWRPTQYSWRDALLVPAIAVGVLVAVFMPVRLSTPAPTVSTVSVVAATNEERLANNLPLLKMDQALNQAAAAKAQDMIAAGVFAHYYNGHTPWQYVDAAGETNWKYAGENLAKNYSQTDSLMDAWMNSPTHRENILNSNYDHIGVAVVHSTLKDGTPISLTVQLFSGS